MTGEYRETSWRQGAVFEFIDGELGGTLGIIASHDCDLAADMEVEDTIEYLPLTLINAMEGNNTFGKNARVLHVDLADETQQDRFAELDIRKRLSVPKDAFFSGVTRCPFQLKSPQLVVFRRWLSARYARSAFANNFEQRIDLVSRRIDRLAKTKGGRIRALYFDVDDNQIIEREVAGDPYELAIYVVYPPDTNDAEAEEFAERLAGIFKERFYDAKTGIWTGIELTSCDAMCEDSFPLALALSTKPWRVDHRSYSDQQAGIDLYPDLGA